MVNSNAHGQQHKSRKHEAHVKKVYGKKFQEKPELNQSQASLGRDSAYIKYAILRGKGQEWR